MTRLIAFIDGSIYSRSVCDHAAWVAQRTGAAVEVMHVLGRREVSSAPVDLSGNLDVDARDHLLSELASLDEERARLAQKRGRIILDEARARIEEAGAATVVTRLRNGDIVEAVEEVQDKADLIVVGKRGEAADFAKLHLGSNLERVVRSAHRPILVASRAFRPVNRFLIAFDGGASARKAVEDVAKNALFRGLDCRILSVGADGGEARANLDAATATLREAGFAVQADIMQGEPAQVIASAVESDGIDLLVMGAYGHSRIRSFIIGSTTSEMIRSCLVPVMLYR